MDKIQIYISLVLFLIMFSIGSGINNKEIKKLVVNRKPIYLGLALQIILLPFLGFLVAYLSPLSMPFKIGIVLVSICPGGTTSNYISYVLKADTALSLSLTVLNSLFIFITIPLYLQLAVVLFMPNQVMESIPLLYSFNQILFLILIPSLLGMYFKYKKPLIAQKIEKPLKRLNTLLLFIVFAIKLFADKQMGGTGILYSEILKIIPYALVLHIVSYYLSFYLSQLFRLSKKKSTTISIEVGLQNTALAILLATVIFNDEEFAKPALVFAIFTFFTTLFFSFLLLRLGKDNRELL